MGNGKWALGNRQQQQATRNTQQATCNRQQAISDIASGVDGGWQQAISDSGGGRKGKGKGKMQAAADDGVSSSDEDAMWELPGGQGAARAGVSGELPRCWIYRQQQQLRRLFQFRRRGASSQHGGVGAAAGPAGPRPGVPGHLAPTTRGSWRIRNTQYATCNRQHAAGNREHAATSSRECVPVSANSPRRSSADSGYL
jgi:hypothetical protein